MPKPPKKRLKIPASPRWLITAAPAARAPTRGQPTNCKSDRTPPEAPRGGAASLNSAAPQPPSVGPLPGSILPRDLHPATPCGAVTVKQPPCGDRLTDISATWQQQASSFFRLPPATGIGSSREKTLARSHHQFPLPRLFQGPPPASRQVVRHVSVTPAQGGGQSPLSDWRLCRR